MNILIFGATGMVGQGALRECLLDPVITRVVTVGRSPTGQQHPRLHEIVHGDLFDLSRIENELGGFDACFFCLGVSVAGMKEADYRRITLDLPVSVAKTLLKLNPTMTFIHISGGGAVSSGSGPMWARVKGEAENALLAMPFKAVHVLRPGAIQPLHGIVSRTGYYNVLYTILSPVMPLLKRLLPAYVTTTELLGRAMVSIAKQGSAKRILENRDINAAGASQV